MPKQSRDEIEQITLQAQVNDRHLVTEDIVKVIHSSTSHLVLKIATYFYDNNTPKDVLCLYGTVATQYRGNRYNIPIQLWLHEDYPMVAPLAYVKPTSDMFISQTSKYVQPDGRIILSYLIEWAYPISNLPSLLEAMSISFGETSPVFTHASNHYESVSISNTSQSISTPNLSSSIAHSPSSSTASNNVNQCKHTHRFSDIVEEPKRMLLPIQGFDKMPVVSLETAVLPLVSLVSDVEQMVWIAKQNCTNPQDGLTSDESASIMLYTLEWEPYETSFYVIFNAALRAASREELKPWFSYLRLITSALEKLPSTHQFVYRGVKVDLSDQYRPGSKVIWWGFSSCAVSIDTLSNERFLGKNGTRTFFTIECNSGKNIRSHSYYENEDEVLLLPARQFEVIACLDQGNGLQIIQLKEVDPKFALIKLNSS